MQYIHADSSATRMEPFFPHVPAPRGSLEEALDESRAYLVRFIKDSSTGLLAEQWTTLVGFGPFWQTRMGSGSNQCIKIASKDKTQQTTLALFIWSHTLNGFDSLRK